MSARRRDVRHRFLLRSGRSVSRRQRRKEYTAMTDYVLIHGAWHGSWCWTRVRRLLAAGAHRVFTPTLTGVGERSHLLSRDVGLDGPHGFSGRCRQAALEEGAWAVVLKVVPRNCG